MIRPARFGANPETAGSNRFQRRGRPGDDAAHALREFDGLAVALAAAGVRVHAFAGARDADLPDEVFPNNWVSFHADGTAVLYPLLAPIRRRERRADVHRRAARRARLSDRARRRPHIARGRAANISRARAASCSIESTASRTPADRRARTIAALAELGRELGYETDTFDAMDRDGHPVYHTNVLLSIGTRFAVLCSSALRDEAERRRLIERLAEAREVIGAELRAAPFVRGQSARVARAPPRP